jgi:6-phosphogluconolactonase (cycloisomerase 2 family)
MQKIIYTIMLSLFTPLLWGADIGSDTAVTRFNTQQELHDGDRVAGFASLDEGFYFHEPGISATWDTFFQVSGNVDLSIATLILNQDLIFRNVSNLTLFGNIDGNGHTVEFSSSMMCVPNPSAGVADCRVDEFDTYTQTAAVNTLDWSVSDSFLAVGLPSHASNELLIYSFVNIPGFHILILEDSLDTSPEDVLTVRWHPTLPLLAVGLTSASGDELFIYSVDSGGNLTLEDSDEIGSDVTAVAWTQDGDFLAVGTDSNPELYIYPVSSAGILGTRTSFDVTGNRSVNRQAMSWDATSVYLAVGFSSAGSFDELRVYSFDSTTTALTLNATNPADNNSVTGVSWNQDESDILAIVTQGGSFRLQVFQHNDGAGTLTLLDEANENNNQGTSIQWGPFGSCLAMGKEGNGSATEFKIYPFDSTTDLLEEPQEFETTGNSGVLSLRWTREGHFIALGLNNNDIVLYDKIAITAQHVCFMWSDVNLVLNSNIELKDTCLTFSGLSTIDGRGHCLTLKSTSSMQIAADSSLLMQNLIIKDLSGHQLAFLDATSTASFKDVTLMLDGDYQIDEGKFDVLGSLDVIGQDYAFDYKTTEVSKILDCGVMTMNDGVTFNYEPPIADSQLVQMTAATSKFVLNSATLHTTTTGLQLDMGVLEIDGLSKIVSDGTVAGEAIVFGDGTLSSRNLTVHLLPAANVELKGFILDNNI